MGYGNPAVVEPVCLGFCLSFTLSQSHRKVFGTSPESDKHRPEALAGARRPTMRERMEIERQERMQAATAAASSTPGTEADAEATGN